MHFHWWIFLAAIGVLLALWIIANLFWTSPLSQLPAWLKITAKWTWLTAKRTVIFLIGTSVVIVGIAMIVLPGPAVIVIPLGLAILATEFVWAKRLLKHAQNHVQRAVNKVRGKNKPTAHNAPGTPGTHAAKSHP